MSERLVQALKEVRDEPVITLGKVIDKTRGEAILIVCLISILPFLQPIPIPGLSTILGVIALLQGVSLIALEGPLLTQRMRDLTIAPEKFELIYKAAVKFCHFTSKISLFKHPIVRAKPIRFVSGITIVLAASFLSLPLPIPFSNFIPAICIFFICTGLLEEDIVLVIFGHAIAFSVAWMGIMSFHLIQEKLQHWF